VKRGRGRRPARAARRGKGGRPQRDRGRSAREPRRQPAPKPARAGGPVEAVVARRKGGLVAVDERGRSWRLADPGAARSGDRVALRPLRGNRAELLGVLGGPRTRWLGILRRRGGGGGGVIAPYRDATPWRILVGEGGLAGAEDGDVVDAELSSHGRRVPALPRGRVTRVWGRPGDPEADFQAVVWRHRLPLEFPAEAEAEAASCSPRLDTASLRERLDLRERAFVTIDPVSARDFDDAVFAEPSAGGGTRLWVAVADVSHYVRPGSALDAEAFRRGNSVYFPERALPMLPERLSGDLCSLRPGTDRLALVAELDYDARARLRARGFHAARMRSWARLSYAEAAAALADRHALVPETAASLARLDALTRALHAGRREQGSLELELPERVVEVDERGRAQAIRRAQPTPAHRLIEEAMLAANRAVAEQLVAWGVPGPFRNHEPPASLEREELVELLVDLRLVPAGAELTPRVLADALRRAAGRPEAPLVNLTALRSLPQARYGAESLGHFALAFPHYLHFTSPIRRYADLAVHRALKARLGVDAPGAAALSAEQARGVATRISWRERVGEAAERERNLLHACAFLAPRVGERFSARVTGVAAHGLYVTLESCFVEGLIHLRRLPGRWQHDARAHRLVERRRRESHALGDALEVRLAGVDPAQGRIDFALAQ